MGATPAVPLTVALALGCPACEKEHCPQFALELRQFEGPAVTETTLTCRGAFSARCLDGPATIHEEACGSHLLRIVRLFPPGGGSYAIYTNDTGDVVRGQYRWTCDDDGCSTEVEDPIGGWVMFEELDWNEGARMAGRFEMIFADGEVSGDFDSTQPGPDASIP